MTSGRSRAPRRPPSGRLEGPASAAVLVGIGVLLGNTFVAHSCLFGYCVSPKPSNVATYWITASIVAVLAAFTVWSAQERGSGPALAWHSIVAVVALLAILIFAVPTTDVPSEVVVPSSPPPPAGCFGENCLGG
ncbi:hypothetical protein ACO229_04095 [Promicromonospora sp. MS192]|uniref:hypothetical protein n=1 Tax=Promicromonospora sp. MS192 TaxID=3412684 RepID=UPI003C2D6C60